MSTLIDTLRNSRNLTLRERTRLLTEAAPRELADLVDERRLNWRETPLLLTLALSDHDDWELDDPGANELGAVLKMRTDDVLDQLAWLERKGLVEHDSDDDGTYWLITDRVEPLLDHGPNRELADGVVASLLLQGHRSAAPGDL